jgi:hypothetical protein
LTSEDALDLAAQLKRSIIIPIQDMSKHLDASKILVRYTYLNLLDFVLGTQGSKLLQNRIHRCSRLRWGME